MSNDIGSRIEKAILAKSLKKAELAKTIGILPQNLNFYLNGQRKPGVEILSKIAIALEVSVDELIFGKPTKKWNSQELKNAVSEAIKNLEEEEFLEVLDKKRRERISGMVKTLGGWEKVELILTEEISMMRKGDQKYAQFRKKLQHALNEEGLDNFSREEPNFENLA